MTGWPRRVLYLLTVVLAIAAQATGASAHASLNSTVPVDGSIVGAAPNSYALTFSEPVAPLVLTLIRPDGSRVALDRFSLKGQTLEIEAPAALGRGTHVLSWRVVSADGHPIGGSLLFSIGEASASAPSVPDVTDTGVRAGLGLSRIALSIGLFIGVGGVFALLVLLRGAVGGFRPVASALALGGAGAVLSAGFQGLDALGAPLARLLDPLVWSAGFATSFGRTVWLSLAAFLAAALALSLRERAGSILATVALLAAAAAPALSGHASAAAPQWLMRPAVALHAGAIAVWIGALLPLAVALGRPGTEALPALRRFSRTIPPFVAILVAAGTVLAVVQVGQPAALVDTAYGKVFLVKLVLLAGLFLLVGVNRWSLTAKVEAGDAAAARRMVRVIGVETMAAVAIFAAAAAWRFTPPPRVLAAEAALPATIELRSDKATVVLWVGPARVGPVDVVANVLSAEYGPLEPRQVSVSFSNPGAGIEPFERRMARGAGMADWHAAAVTLPLPGLWRVRVDVLISDFEIARIEGELRIRP
jgi:copper transport protein